MPEQILLVVGLLMSIIGPALTFRGRRSRGYIMDIDDALPWMGGLALVGAGLLLLAQAARRPLITPGRRQPSTRHPYRLWRAAATRVNRSRSRTDASRRMPSRCTR